jgi:hypothetical protein
MAADLSIRPLGLAEVIDRSIAVGLRHFRALFLAMLIVQAPALFLARELSGLVELLGAVSEPDRAGPLLAGALARLAWLFVSLAALQLVATAAAAAIVRPTLDPRRGERPSGRRVVAAIAGASVLQLVLLSAAPAAGALPGVLLALRAQGPATAVTGAVGALVGGVGLFLVVTLRTLLTPVVAAVEGRAGPGALARSFRLMAPRPGTSLLERPGVRASLVLLAALILALAVNGLAALPRLVALRLQSGPGGLALLGAHLPLGAEILVSLLEAVAGAALQPFSLVAVAVFYFDRRARTEALDLEIWAERLEAGA